VLRLTGVQAPAATGVAVKRGATHLVQTKPGLHAAKLQLDNGTEDGRVDIEAADGRQALVHKLHGLAVVTGSEFLLRVF